MHLVGGAMNNPSSALSPIWTMKLTEAWGEPKNDSKGEDNGLKIGQNSSLTRFLTSVCKKCLLCRLCLLILLFYVIW